MKVLVTGGAGFIGTNFCLYAKSKGLQVLALDNLSKRESRKNLKILKGEGIAFKKADIKQPLQQEFGKINAIVHLASHCSTPRSIEIPYEDFLDNALGTLNILEFAREHGKIPLIYASTIKVYPDSLNNLPIKELETRYEFADREGVAEDFPIEKGSHAPYGCSKYVGDLYCQEYFLTYQVPTVINRMSTIFGPYQYGTEEAGWIYHFVKSKKKNTPVTIYGTGKQVRDALWVEDLCKLLLKQIESIDKVKGQVYNVGGGKENSLSLLELVDYLNKMGEAPMKVRVSKTRPSDLKVFISDLSKLKKDLNWSPTTSVWKGIDILYKRIR